MNEDELTQKDIDEYNKRINEEYQEKTKANEELRKKQEQGRQLDIPGLDQQLGGTAFEIGANLALDAGTSWLLGVPEGFLTKGLYGIANVGGSAIINAIAQKMRGDKFSLGELVGTSAASLIPGAVTGKGVARSALRGATTAGVEQNIRSIVDDDKVLGFGDQVSAFATGGVLGTGFDFAGKGISKTQFFQGLAEKMNRGKSNLYTDLVNAAISDDSIVKQGGSVNIPPPTSSDFGGDGGFFKRVVEKVMRNKRTAPSLFVDPVTLKPKRGFTQFEMASALDRYIDNLSKKSGYKSLADFKVQVLDELKEGDKLKLFKELQEGENLQTGYIEHMIAKASKKNRLERLRQQMPVLSMDEDYLASELSRRSQNSFDMDWYWSDTYIDQNGITRPGLNKGDRNASKNVRINFNNRYKALKDVTENILYGTEAAPGIGTLSPKLENRLIVSVEDIDKRSFIFNRTQLGDVVIRRAGDNKLIGKIGNYLDVLYPQNNNARSLLQSNVLQQINPDTGARFTSLDEFRDYIIRKRIEIIVNDAPNLSRKSNKQRRLIIDKALQDDLIKLYEKYPFLPKPKYISEITNRGLDQNVGPFPSKTQQRKYIQGQLKGRLDE
tara:strand:- start:37 stop:1866 length:1830 start_codon:yes stop_codon:yes gene_type:complete